jgi:hypothetical protein
MAYSDNLLINGSGEFGLQGWSGSGISITVGATQGSYSFKLASTSEMKQIVTFEKSPPDIKFEMDYWLNETQDPLATRYEGNAVLRLIYNDGSRDFYAYPLAGVSGKWHGIREVIQLDTSEDVRQLSSAEFSISCTGLPGGLYVDSIGIFKQESDTSDIDTGKYDDFWMTAITYGLDKDKPLLRG